MYIFTFLMTRVSLPVYLSILAFMALFTSSFTQSTGNILMSKTGTVKFVSEAPLELIKAESAQLMCIIDISKRTFAFSMPINTFAGFNNPLQREHFLDNYMEADKFKNATFSGKIIEEEDLSKDGTYTVRAKGMLNIHGVEKEKIIKAKVTVKNSEMTLDAHFDVPLEDHNIKVPKIINQKIAQVISVDVKASLSPKK